MKNIKLTLLYLFIAFISFGQSGVIISPVTGGALSPTEQVKVDYSLLYLNSMAAAQPFFGDEGAELVVEDGEVYLDINGIIDGVGDNDIPWVADGVLVTLNCTSNTGTDGKARVKLIQGTENTVQRQTVYSYVDDKTGTVEITTSITDPAGTFLPICYIGIQDYASVETYGGQGFQRTTECFSHGGWGGISRMRYNNRHGSGWLSGVDPVMEITTNAGSMDIVNLTTTEGSYIQMNKQNVPAFDISTDGFFLITQEGDERNLDYMTNIGDITHDINGDVFVNDNKICFYVFVNVNISGAQSKIYVIPGEQFPTDGAAMEVGKYGGFPRLPKWADGVSMPIATLVLKYNDTNNGSWTNVFTEVSYGWVTQSVSTYKSENYPNYYSNNTNTGFTFDGGSDAIMVKANFNYTVTESGYDKIFVGNTMPSDGGSGADYTYQGTLSAFTSATISGRYFYIKWHTDSSVTKKPGWYINSFSIYKPTPISTNYILDKRM